jgi:hypothetical protein
LGHPIASIEGPATFGLREEPPMTSQSSNRPVCQRQDRRPRRRVSGCTDRDCERRLELNRSRVSLCFRAAQPARFSSKPVFAGRVVSQRTIAEQPIKTPRRAAAIRTSEALLPRGLAERITWLLVGDLKPFPSNPRRHPAAGARHPDCRRHCHINELSLPSFLPVPDFGAGQ